MSVDIRCLSIDPSFFYANLTPNDPLFSSVHTQCDPLFSTFVSMFACTNYKLSSRISEIYQILLYYNIHFANFGLKLHICTLNDPHFGGPHQKRSHFLGSPYRMTPFFQRNLTPNAPYFLSPVGTCTPLSYSGVPPGTVHD